MPSNSKEYQSKNYAKYWGTARALKERAKRNAARRMMEKEGRVSKGDGKEIDHKRGVSAGNGKANLRVLSMVRNRVLGQKKAMKPGRKKVYDTK